MDTKTDRKFSEVTTSADSIIAFFEEDSKAFTTVEEWASINEELQEWFNDPEISNEEKWQVRLSGYMEMVAMILR